MSDAKPGHGDHWLAALGEGHPFLRRLLDVPADAAEEATLHRQELTDAIDLVQVTARSRLITAYPEPRATALALVKPRELLLWEEGVEGWLVGEHADAGALTFFVTDLVERAEEYQKLRGSVEIELSALAYGIERVEEPVGPARLRPARSLDARFLPDDYAFDADVDAAVPTRDAQVLDLHLQGALVVPTVARDAPPLPAHAAVRGLLWLTGRLPR